MVERSFAGANDAKIVRNELQKLYMHFEKTLAIL